MPNAKKKTRGGRNGFGDWRILAVIAAAVLLKGGDLHAQTDTGFSWKRVEEAVTKALVEIVGSPVAPAPPTTDATFGAAPVTDDKNVLDESDLLATDPELFGTTALNSLGQSTIPGSVCTIDRDAATPTRVCRWHEYVRLEDVSSTSTKASMINRLPGDTYVVDPKLVLYFTAGRSTVSSTVQFFMGTSSTATLAPEYNQPTLAADNILDGDIYATGSPRAVVASSSPVYQRIPDSGRFYVWMTTGGSSNIHGSSATSSAGLGISNDSYILIGLENVTTSTPSYKR